MTAAALPTLADVYAAERRLGRYLTPSPLRYSDWLSAAARAEVHIKVESVQPTHSFKIRGALNAAMRLLERSGPPPVVVTASAGNHGRALAFAAERLGLQAVVFTPASAPATKKAAIRRHGAALRDDAADYDTAEHDARAFARAEHALYISPYNHADVIAGAGTIALELLQVLPTLSLVVVPVGGGGLASGVALALKRAAPHVRIVGVEAEASTALGTSVARGAITSIEPEPSIADGLTGNLEQDSMTFELVQRYVDDLVSVTEADLEMAISGLAEEEHLVAEGAGAAATAAVIGRQVVARDGRAVVLMTGGNIDLAAFHGVVARRVTGGDRHE
jgi:threonine dehydratase